MISRPLSLVGRRELFLFLGAYLIYSMSRYISVGDITTATDHARWIVDLQQSIGVNVETSVQSALQRHRGDLDPQQPLPGRPGRRRPRRADLALPP